MSENQNRHRVAEESLRECKKLLELFEIGQVELSPGFVVTFTPAQITSLKQAYAAARTAGRSAWAEVSAQ